MEDESVDLDSMLSMTWGRFMMQERFRSAACFALLIYFDAAESRDSERQKAADSMFMKSIEEMTKAVKSDSVKNADAELTCSFCGRSKGVVKLVAGAGANICEECAETALEALRIEPAPE